MCGYPNNFNYTWIFNTTNANSTLFHQVLNSSETSNKYNYSCNTIELVNIECCVTNGIDSEICAEQVLSCLGY